MSIVIITRSFARFCKHLSWRLPRQSQLNYKLICNNFLSLFFSLPFTSMNINWDAQKEKHKENPVKWDYIKPIIIVTANVFLPSRLFFFFVFIHLTYLSFVSVCVKPPETFSYIYVSLWFYCFPLPRWVYFFSSSCLCLCVCVCVCMKYTFVPLFLMMTN